MKDGIELGFGPEGFCDSWDVFLNKKARVRIFLPALDNNIL